MGKFFRLDNLNCFLQTPMFSCPEEKTSLENVILTDKVQVIKEKRSRNRQPRGLR